MEGFSGNIDWGDIALATDFYELTMAAAYYYSNYRTDCGSNKIKGIFEMFVRKLPRNRSYLVAAGLDEGANAWIEFEGGDPDHPIWTGWDIGKTPIRKI